MKKKLNKAILLGATMILSMGMMTGCTGEFEKAQENLNKTGLDQLQHSKVVREVTDEEFSHFKFLCAEFEVNDDKTYDVDVNGVAKYNDGKEQAYVKMSYTLDGQSLYEVNKDDRAAILNLISQTMSRQEMKAFDYAPLSSIKAINSILRQTAESPLDEFNYRHGILFSLGKIKFDEDKDRVCFEMKTHVKYERPYTVMQPIVVGNMMTMMPVTHYENEEFIHTNDVYLNVSKEEMARMKADNKLIFDKFVDVVKKQEFDKYVINSVEVDKLDDLDISLFNSLYMDENELF
ncbi:MAG: hypothetical protein HFI85_05485 [Clostridia bacterium]|jgi:hypothetical protein|nr:hypothetical protein [Clostridia bacterium]